MGRIVSVTHCISQLGQLGTRANRDILVDMLPRWLPWRRQLGLIKVWLFLCLMMMVTMMMGLVSLLDNPMVVPAAKQELFSITTIDQPRASSTTSVPVQAQAFFEQHCEMNDPSGWWPSRHNHQHDIQQEWKLRTPSFMIIGAKKTGTTTLWSWLIRKAWSLDGDKNRSSTTSTMTIVPASKKELLHFMPAFFPPHFWKNSSTRKVQVDPIRQLLWNMTNGTSTTTSHTAAPTVSDDKKSVPYYSAAWMQAHPHTITFEATPDYLLYSTLSRIPILCTFPWVKIVVILRNPLERTISNFNFDQQFVKTKSPFEEVVELDWNRLSQSGVFSELNRKDMEAAREGERLAWQRYQEILERGMWGTILGRSLYVLQLEEWYDSLRALGRDPTRQILIVRNEDMATRPEWVVDKVLAWLGDGRGDAAPDSDIDGGDGDGGGGGVTSSDHIATPILAQKPRWPTGNHGAGSSSKTDIYASKMITQYQAPPISNATRDRLQEMFEPYNQRLYRLLGWGPELHWPN